MLADLRRMFPLLLGLGTAVALVAAAPTSVAQPAPDAGGTYAAEAPSSAATPKTAITRWSTARQFDRGTHAGTRVRNDALRIGKTHGTLTFAGRRYASAGWTSPWRRTRFGTDELIPSWNADTPGGTILQVRMRGRLANGKRGSWDTIATWAAGDRRIKRTTYRAQGDDFSGVNVDTVTLNGKHRYRSWQVRVTLARPRNPTNTPAVRSIGAIASASAKAKRGTSSTTMRRTRVLKVPEYSQMIHEGEYPQWDGGGEAWCSPTSTSMVLRAYGSGPKPREYAWVKDGYRDPWVDHAARHTYDYRYEGAGNWPFNTAYAGTYGMDAFVTRLTSFRQAEKLIRAGIPIVINLEWEPGELDGAPLRSSGGHLLVVRGFRQNGDVIVNDPAAARNKTVRRTYRRDQLEKLWRRASGGMTYVIRKPGTELPKGSGGAW